VLRDSKGQILGLEAGFLGDTTNNVAELTGLLRGLQSAIGKGHHQIILEGDSQVIIGLATKLIHGGNLDKASPSWRLQFLLEDLSQLLQPQISIITAHVRREANKVADCLANVAVERELEHLYWEPPFPPDPEIFHRCHTLATEDLQAPDGVTRRAGETRGSQPGLPH
jgi:ribonuclease HI